MRKEKKVMQKRAFQILKVIAACISFLALQFVSIAPICADDSIPVVCYVNGRPVGNVSVFNVVEAARTCNITYYDCRGRCVGCFHDFDYVENVCVDDGGNTFLRS